MAELPELGSPTFELDAAQRRVANAEASERLYVTAGPGSGKTETVSARIEFLSEEEGLAGSEILVISFSRAAVEAVQRRQRQGQGRAWAWVTTIDSLAARLLGDLGEEVAGRRFDERIDKLATLLREDPDEQVLADVQHVIIDEVQDVVGRRAELVAALLGALPESVGFTMLGDPKQGIYDFQLDDVSSDPYFLLHQARELGATELVLKGQHRAATSDARTAMALRGRDVDDLRWAREMEAHVATMPIYAAGELSAQINGLSGSIAVLTQSNAQALTIARDLYQSGTRAELLSRAADRSIDPWLAELLGEATTSLTREDFTDLVNGRAPVEADEAWGLCRRITRAHTKFLNVIQLAQRFAMGIVPVALTRARERVTVSTVHRAKGLEFDHVFLLDPLQWYGDDDVDRARVLYVAITRPRRRLFTFQQQANDRWWKADLRSERAYRTGPKGKGTVGFEVRGSDWRSIRPPASDEDAVAAVHKLREMAAEPSPTPVEVRFDAYSSTQRRPVYRAFIDDVIVGSLGQQFVDEFTRRVGASQTRWPDIQGLYFTGLETVAGPTQDGPVGRNGLWLSPLIVGPAELDWRRP